jgi:hypothetical protein
MIHVKHGRSRAPLRIDSRETGGILPNHPDQHCSEKHLHRYLAEFDFRYNNRSALGVEDPQRSDAALKGIVGKRLTYGVVGPR